jgi:sugar O-acyltransferase (sialic acid O-acetyltransferase NeuD family)
MSRIVAAPTISANEDTVTLVRWLKADGDAVRPGEMLCEVETTKATVEVEADAGGFLRRLAEEGAQLRVGAPLAALLDNADEDVAPLLARLAAPAAATEKRWTKKAEILAKRKGIDIEALARAKGGPVTEADLANMAAAPKPVLALAPAAPARRIADLHEDRYPANRPERVLLLGGGAGAGAMTVDVLSRVPHQRAVGILDSNAETHGKTVGGVPVLGALDRVDALWAEGFFDGAIILFTQDVVEREGVFRALKAKGIRFANVIDPTVEIRGGTAIGEGNLVMARVYFSTAVAIGDNNFFASHCCVEHHSRVGSHCAFGPRTTTSGAVTIGDRVKTGMAVAVEPYLSIGSDTMIASGCVITSDIPAGSLVRAQQGHTVRPMPTKNRAVRS